MGSLGNTYENNALDAILGPGWTLDPTVWVALATSAPSDSSFGTEVAGGTYARVAVTNNVTNWPAASGGSKSNGTAITFPTPTALWGTITHFVVANHASASAAANIIGWAALTTPRTPAIGDLVRFAAGALVLTAD